MILEKTNSNTKTFAPIPNVVEVAIVAGSDLSGRVKAVNRAPRPLARPCRVAGGAEIKRLTYVGVGKENVSGLRGYLPREGASVTRVGFHNHVPCNLLIEIHRDQVVTCLF